MTAGKSIENLRVVEVDLAQRPVGRSFIGIRTGFMPPRNKQEFTRTYGDWTSTLFHVMNPATREEIKNTQKGITLRVPDNDALTIEELTEGFKSLKTMRRGANLQDGITFDVRGLSTGPQGLVTKITKAYTAAGLPGKPNFVGPQQAQIEIKLEQKVKTESKKLAAAAKTVIEQSTMMEAKARQEVVAPTPVQPQSKNRQDPVQQQTPRALPFTPFRSETKRIADLKDTIGPTSDISELKVDNRNFVYTPNKTYNIQTLFQKLENGLPYLNADHSDQYSVKLSDTLNSIEITRKTSPPSRPTIALRATDEEITRIRLENGRLHFGPSTDNNLQVALISALAIEDPNKFTIKFKNTDLLEKALTFCDKRKCLGRIELSPESEEVLKTARLVEPALSAFNHYKEQREVKHKHKP